MTLVQRTKSLLAHKLYDLLVTLSVPFFLGLIYFKGRRNPDYRRPLVQRLARKLDNYPVEPIWFHAVSDGEFYAARRLIGLFLDAYPNTPILITTTTPTGKDRVESEFKDVMNKRVWHAYLPFDQVSFTKRFLNKIQPIASIFVETEIWPNFLTSLDVANIPCALVNARLSEKSYLGYRRFGIFAANTVNHFDLIITQDAASATRFQLLLSPIRTPNTQLMVSGNLKLDINIPDDLAPKTAILRKKMGTKPFWVAASTHVGEDNVMLSAQAKLRQKDHDLTLLIAPRHPERSADIVALCKSKGFRAVCFSQLTTDYVDHNAFDIVILDSIGQLLYFYAECEVAVIAGSFVEHGGHNPLEATLFKKPVITGPHYFNFQTLIDALQSKNGIKIATADTLSNVISELLAEPEPLASNGYQYLQANRGTTDKTFSWLQTLM